MYWGFGNEIVCKLICLEISQKVGSDRFNDLLVAQDFWGRKEVYG